MKQLTSRAACLLAAALAGCGGGGGANSGAGTSDSTGGTAQTSSVVQTSDSGAPTNNNDGQANGDGNQTQFPLRAVQQGDERTYEIVDTFSDGSKFSYARKTLQAVLNADGSGERQVYDANGRLLDREIRTYDQNGLPSRYFTSTNVTCTYSAQRSGFASPMRVGQTFENKITDTCDNGYSAVIDESGTIVGAETVTVSGASYSTLKAIVTENGVVMPPAPATSYSYAITRTEWIEPALGLRVKEDSFYSLGTPPDGIYQTARSTMLQSYLNK